MMRFLEGGTMDNGNPVILNRRQLLYAALAGGVLEGDQ